MQTRWFVQCRFVERGRLWALGLVPHVRRFVFECRWGSGCGGGTRRGRDDSRFIDLVVGGIGKWLSGASASVGSSSAGNGAVNPPAGNSGSLAGCAVLRVMDACSLPPSGSGASGTLVAWSRKRSSSVLVEVLVETWSEAGVHRSRPPLLKSGPCCRTPDNASIAAAAATGLAVEKSSPSETSNRLLDASKTSWQRPHRTRPRRCAS
jgi:hypothetical protein